MSPMRITRPLWIPRKIEMPGLALAFGFGALSLVIARFLPRSPLFSDLLLAILLGATVRNVPLLRRVFRVGADGDDHASDRHAAGLRFVGRWVLRAAIVLLGLKIDASQLHLSEFAIIGGVLLVSLPSTFMVVHAVAPRLGVRRQLADLVAIGTMVCGASAITATAPVVGARRQEQAVSIATVFLFSVVALFGFKPLAMAMGLGEHAAGLWSGLSVNDLSSAVAVGDQMGELAGPMAAASKSARVLLLGPMLLVMAFLRRDAAKPKELREKSGDVLPLFVVGFVGFAILRSFGDRMFGGAPIWSELLWSTRLFVDFLMASVAVAIGINFEFSRVIAVGFRTLLLGGVASGWMAATSLTLVTLASRGQVTGASIVGFGAIVLSVLAYKILATSESEQRVLRLRFAGGAPLSLWEATRLLDGFERADELDDARLRQLMLQLHPSSSELIPLRSSPLPHGEGCRWLTYWEGKSGRALVALAREPHSQTPIHAHPHRLLGKSVEGRMEELRFSARDADGMLELLERRPLAHNDLIETDALNTIHLVRVLGDQAAIDLQLRGPEIGSPGRRYCTLGVFDPATCSVGDRIAVGHETDDRPGHGGEGAKAGVLSPPVAILAHPAR